MLQDASEWQTWNQKTVSFPKLSPERSQRSMLLQWWRDVVLAPQCDPSTPPGSLSAPQIASWEVDDMFFFFFIVICSMKFRCLNMFILTCQVNTTCLSSLHNFAESNIHLCGLNWCGITWQHHWMVLFHLPDVPSIRTGKAPNYASLSRSTHDTWTAVDRSIPGVQRSKGANFASQVVYTR